MSELFAKPFKLADVATALLSNYTSDADEVIAAIAGIEQTELKTDLMAVFDTVVPDLLAFTADRRILLIISDGEHTVDADRQVILDSASVFKQAGGVIIVIGVRASGVGYDFLERLATGGYFINATSSNAEDAILGLNYLKSLLCAGNCAVVGNVYQSIPQRNYHAFENFEVVDGKVNLLGPGLLDLIPENGMYVEMSEAGEKGTIRTSTPISLLAGGTYRISFSAAGNQRAELSGQGIKVYVREVDADSADPNVFEQIVFPDWDDGFQSFSLNFIPVADVSVRLYFQQVGTDSAPSYGSLLDNVKFEQASTLVTLLEDNFDSENTQFIAPSCGGNDALPTIDDPGVVVSENLTNFGEEMDGGPEVYKYGVSFVTAEGETKATIQGDGDDGFAFAYEVYLDGTIKLTLPTPSGERVVSIRIWRTLGDPFESTPSGELYLLAEVPANQVVYLDQERRDDFVARYDNSVVAPTENTTAVASGGLGEGYDCELYECSASAPGVQSPDSSPLPDIESGYTPPQQFTSTKSYCATCPPGQQNNDEENLIPEMDGESSPSGLVIASADDVVMNQPWMAFDKDSSTYWIPTPGATTGYIGYKFDEAKTVGRYTIAAIDPPVGAPSNFTFEGSNNGTSWTVLDTRFRQSWYAGEKKSFSVANPASYLYYRINITATFPGLPTQNLNVAEVEMFGSASNQVCKTETRTSYVSQADADALATAAAKASAEAALNCGQVFTATESFTAVCPFNQFGQPVTKSATRTSHISQLDAQTQALAAAQAEAEAELVCSLSNNNLKTIINDNTKATPYPSVKNVSGLSGLVTKVTVALNGLTHPSPDDIKILLIAPDGTTNCLLMANCGGVPLDGGSIVNVNLTLDQSAGSALPDGVVITSGTYRPAQYGSVGGPGLLPLPVPISIVTYGASLNVFNGIDPNGSWSLWIFDDLSLFDGSLNSWDLTITTA